MLVGCYISAFLIALGCPIHLLPGVMFVRYNRSICRSIAAHNWHCNACQVLVLALAFLLELVLKHVHRRHRADGHLQVYRWVCMCFAI